MHLKQSINNRNHYKLHPLALVNWADNNFESDPIQSISNPMSYTTISRSVTYRSNLIGYWQVYRLLNQPIVLWLTMGSLTAEKIKTVGSDNTFSMTDVVKWNGFEIGLLDIGILRDRRKETKQFLCFIKTFVWRYWLKVMMDKNTDILLSDLLLCFTLSEISLG